MGSCAGPVSTAGAGGFSVRKTPRMLSAMLAYHVVTQHPDVVSLVASLGEKSGTDAIFDALNLMDLAEDYGIPQQE